MCNQDKLCPLRNGTIYCGNRCAWWDEESQACALLVIAKAVRKVSKNGR